jgi:chemotaxis protein methyltransferase WspC
MKASAPLRILSVPCSTGEEPYTLAMCLADCGIGSGQAHIDAVDISSVNLATAQRAEYGSNSFRSSDLSFRDRHFEAVGQCFRLRDATRARVSFARANVLDRGFLAGREPYHVIFCRNLLIYFDRTTQHQVIDNLSSLLVEDGLLFLGHSETSLLKDRPYIPMDFPRSFGFMHRQPPARSQPASDSRKTRRAPSQPPAVRPKRGSVTPFADFRSDKASGTDVAPQEDNPLENAFRLADEGHLDEAAVRCEALLKQDPCQAEAHYLLGVIREATGNTADAEKLFRKAVYLAPDHYEALTHLSVICERKGDRQGAQRFRDRATRTQSDVKSRQTGR